MSTSTWYLVSSEKGGSVYPVGDVQLLVHAFVKKYGQGRITGIDADAMKTLEAYGWPGNVRELQNIIERACALSEGEVVTRRDLPEHVLVPAAPPVSGKKRDEYFRERALRRLRSGLQRVTKEHRPYLLDVSVAREGIGAESTWDQEWEL